MTDETKLQLTLNQGSTSLILAEARTALFARGRVDASTLGAQFSVSSLPASELQRFAALGDAEAQCAMGDLLEDFGSDLLKKLGEGEESDQRYAEAAFWYAQAAMQGVPKAQRMLGVLYLTGLGVPANGQKAHHWFSKAADQGDDCAQTTIDALLRNGIWTTQLLDRWAETPDE